MANRLSYARGQIRAAQTRNASPRAQTQPQKPKHGPSFIMSRRRKDRPKRVSKISLYAFLALIGFAALNFAALGIWNLVNAARYEAASHAEITSLLYGPRDLLLPVAGVRPLQLRDTWGEARANGRVHQGIDIPAASGTPVRAVADGRITRFLDSANGGIAIDQADAKGKTIFYYAHLLRRADGLTENAEVKQGQVIGYVGATGDATAPHLHFEIRLRPAGAIFGRGEVVDPYPYLLSGEAPS